MLARCKKDGEIMELVEEDDRQDWSWKTFRCPQCGRVIKEKFDEEEIEL